jgi:hypothetical protein
MPPTTKQLKEKAVKVKAPKPEKPKKLANKCLLLKTPDQRCFFTEEKNYPLLVEFGRTFDAEISVVKTVDQVEVLELDDLAKTICTQVENPAFLYEVLEVKLATPVKEVVETRKNKIKQAEEVREHIKEVLMSGKTLTVADLEAKFPETPKVCLVAYFSRMRRRLEAAGHNIVREKPGSYRLANELKHDYFDF